jgi:uncharacterized protein
MIVKNKKNFIAIRLMLMISCIYIIALILGTPRFIVMAEASTHSAHIEDNAGILSDSVESNLLQKLTDYAEKSNLDLVILTTNDLNTKVKDDDDAITNYVKGYLEDYIDENIDNGTFTEDVAILYFDSAYRWLNIQGYGSAESILNDDRIETILDKISSYFREDDYYNAFLNFGKNAKYYATLQSTGNSSNSSQNGSNNTSPNGSHGNNYNNGHGQTSQNNYDDAQRQFVENVLYKTWFQLLAAIIIGVITVAIMASRSGGRVTTNNHTYLNEGNSGLVARRDDYISTSVTKVKRPEPNNTTNTTSHGSFSGGGRSSGGGGVSSGGRSHSGGGRRV